MTIEEIRKNAPLGATHYRPDWNGDPVYYSHKKNGMLLWVDDEGWMPSKVTTKNQLLKPL